MVAIEPKIFVDTDILIDIAPKDSRALDFWRPTETRLDDDLLCHLRV